MEIKNLEGTSVAELTAAFNLSFSDYIIPLVYTDASMSKKIYGDNIDLSLSPGFFVDGQLCGFIFHGIGEREGQPVIWNGGTGVAPVHRGKGVTNRLYEFILPVLRNKGFNWTVLEVIEGNDPAIHIYKKNGFEVSRQLECYKGEIKYTAPPAGIIFKKIGKIDWSVLHRFRSWQPTFQNNDPKLNLLEKNVLALGAFENDQLVGYIIFAKDAEDGNVYQFAVKESHRKKGIGKSLFSMVAKEKTVPVKVINVDQRAEASNNFFKQIGFERIIGQFEMLKKL